MSMYIKITENSFEAWFLNYFQQEAINRMAAYGVDVCGELTYYTNTSKLFERFRDEIWQLATKYSESCLGESLMTELAADHTTSSPAMLATDLVKAAAAYLSFSHQSQEKSEDDEGNQATRPS